MHSLYRILILYVFCVFYVLPAHAVIELKTSYAGGSETYLDAEVASTCGQLDATISASYGGSGQTWTNVISSPNDGSSQTDNDFWLGHDTNAAGDDPTFTGSAGSNTAYFALDGGDNFNVKSYSAATTLYDAHKSGASGSQWWVAAVFYRVGSSVKSYWGSGFNSSDTGTYTYIDPNGTSRLYRMSGSSSNVIISPGSNHSESTPTLMIISVDNTATTNNVRVWTNTNTKTVYSYNGGTFTGNGDTSWGIASTYTNTTTASSRLDNLSRYYGFAWGDAFIDDADADKICEYYETLHNRDYDGDLTTGTCT